MSTLFWIIISPKRLGLFVLVLLGLMVGLFLVLKKPAAKPVALLERRPILECQVLTRKVRFVLRDPKAKKLLANVPWRVSLSTIAGLIVARGTTSSSLSSSLEIPYQRAGLTAYRVTVGQYQFDRRFIKKPGAPITPLELKVGARAVRVVGSRDPALVMHPLDAQENVSDFKVAVIAKRPDGQTWAKTLSIKHLLAWSFIPPGRRTGLLKISATTGNARGERGEVDVQPGPISNASLKVAALEIADDRRESWNLRLVNVQDARGNPVLNGNATEFAVSSGAYRLFATRPTVRASSSLILAPNVPAGQYALEGRGDTFRSANQTLRAEPAIRFHTIPTRFKTGFPFRLEVGPVSDLQGSLPDNGTPVHLEVWSQTLEYSVTLPLQNGMLEWILPPLPARAKSVRIVVGGRDLSVLIPKRKLHQ